MQTVKGKGQLAFAVLTCSSQSLHLKNNIRLRHNDSVLNNLLGISFVIGQSDACLLHSITIIFSYVFKKHGNTSSSSSEESCGVRSCSLPDKHSRVWRFDFISRSRLPTSMQYDKRRSSYSGPQAESSDSSYKKSKFVNTLIWKRQRMKVCKAEKLL